ncbi:MAG TPA: cupin domain-containing protein [Thioploca sp.]|nr:MAG: cupin domain-containing protein [Gammaproteobacteria bacterium]HDN25552.1 cupin domain-containing protein [Thioploca sp.]
MSDGLVHHKFSAPVESAIVATDWKARGYSCDLFTDPPGREWNDFVHNCDEVVTVLDGQLEMTVEGQHFILEPGDEVFIPRHVLHCVKNLHHATTHWLYGYNKV